MRLPNFVALGVATPDYVVPVAFLFPNGGALDYAGVDSVAYPTLPGGVDSLSRTGAVAVNSPTNFAGQTGSIGPAAPAAVAGVPTLGGFALAVLASLVGLAALFLRRQ